MREAAESMQQCHEEIGELDKKIEASRAVIKKIEKEVSDAGTTIASLRENIRLRKVAKEIQQLQAQIDSHDLEEAARARRNFEAKYDIEKQKESDLQTSVCICVLFFSVTPCTDFLRRLVLAHCGRTEFQ